MRGVVPLGVQTLFLLRLLLQVTLPCLPNPFAARSMWPWCGGPRPWAPGSSRPCLDSTMPSTSTRCVPWGHTHPPSHTSGYSCLFTRAMFPCANALLAAAAGTRDWPGQFCAVLGALQPGTGLGRACEG